MMRHKQLIYMYSADPEFWEFEINITIASCKAKGLQAKFIKSLTVDTAINALDYRQGDMFSEDRDQLYIFDSIRSDSLSKNFEAFHSSVIRHSQSHQKSLYYVKTKLKINEMHNNSDAIYKYCGQIGSNTSENEWIRWIQEHASLIHSKPIPESLASAIMLRTGASPRKIWNALGILALADIGSKDLRPSDLNGLLGEDPSFHAFALAEAALAGNAPRALGILRSLADQGEDAAALLPALGFQFRRLCEGASEIASGTPPGKTSAARSVPPSARPALLRALERADLRRAQAGVRLLQKADLRLKTGRSQGLAVMERLVVRLCGAQR